MKIRIFEFVNDSGRNRLRIHFDHHRATIFTSEIDATKKNVLGAKLKVIEEYLKKEVKPRYNVKEILKEWAKSDGQIKEYYKQNFDNRGGSRKGAGRKVGSFPNGVKTDKTEQFAKAVNKDEKEFLTFCLKWYRAKLKQNPEELKRIMHVYRMYGVEAFLSESFDGKLRTIKEA